MATSASPFAAAIAQLEGFGKANAIPTLANNPGDLELGDIGYGTMAAAGGHAITIFPDLASGVAALENQANKMVLGGSSVYSPSESIAQAGATYGGSASYGQKLASLLGVNSSSSLASLANDVSGSSNTGALLNSTLNPSAPSASQTASNAAGTVETITVIILGLLLIAAGVFAFKQTQTIIENGGRVARRVAEVAA